MNIQTFVATISREIAAPINDVWFAWADQTKWSSWVCMNMTSDFRINGKYNNGKGEGGRYLIIVPMKRIQFTWEMKRYKPGSIIDITFESIENQATQCKLIHSNLQTQADKADSELGWNWALDSLKQYLEAGKPLSWEEWENMK